ncbi:hypothetical protein CH373_13525 [Leptospira perolatii]|uniref:DUF2079 domain-containing protein n=1 Tax=Leptospira perolatii TaxID=2023191 RepID=A0A2M9ZKY2_9LEPT|nr:DUF2079 domain-containing protein [Leptospira perolatii]PJZ69875.1 hypothetical protein CH360_08160 [Leptospira perolatii]PJZ72717.1 hypothetical protein CH373_13525 [Leptospira perolatii]
MRIGEILQSFKSTIQEKTYFSKSGKFWTYYFLPTLLLLWYGLFFFSYNEKAKDAYIPMAWDQSLYEQAISNIAYELDPHVSILGGEVFFKNHFTPILYFLAGLYRFFHVFWEPPLTFIIFTGIVYAFLIIGVYYCAISDQKKIANILLVFSILAFSPVFNSAIGNGFRESVLTLLPISFLLYYWNQNKVRPFTIWALVLLMIKEDCGLIVFGFALLPGKDKNQGFRIVSLLCLAEFVGINLLYTNIFGGLTGQERFSHLGKNIMEIMLSPIIRPAEFLKSFLNIYNIIFLRDLLLSFCFLPLLRPTLLVPSLPYLAVLLLNSDHTIGTANSQLWYMAPLLPFLLLASVQGFERLMDRFANHAKVKIAITCCAVVFPIYITSSGSYLWHRAKDNNVGDSVLRIRNYLNREIPLYTVNNYMPYFSDRKLLYGFQPLIQDGLVLLPIGLSNPANWQGCCTAESYLKLVQNFSETHKVNLIYQDENIALWNTRISGSPGNLQSPTQNIEAEFTPSEFIGTQVNRFHLGKGERIMGYSYSKTGGIAMIGSLHTIPLSSSKIVLTLRISEEDSSQCNEKKRPEIYLKFENGNLLSQRIRFETSEERKFFFDISKNSGNFFPLLKYNRCGKFAVDWYKIEYLK